MPVTVLLTDLFGRDLTKSVHSDRGSTQMVHIQPNSQTLEDTRLHIDLFLR